MNVKWKPPTGPITSVGEVLLADTAIKVELPPSMHRLAVERYEAIRNHIERIGSRLREMVRLFYPQGSMAIRATIRAKRRDDGFDIDIIVELDLPEGTPPDFILDQLYEAVRGDPGSRYHDCTERQTRCITVYYADGMHLDLTPSILIDASDPRKSVIFHSKPEAPRSTDKTIIINSHAFAEDFNLRNPVDQVFADEYARRVMKADLGLVQADAEAEDVPEHSSLVGGKSANVVALQLLKRNRNIRYASRNGVRMPPSVMLSCMTVEVARPGRSIGEALDVISKYVLDELEQAHSTGRLIEVRNPTCPQDCFTDRWPENLDAQAQYIRDLKKFRQQLAQLFDNRLSLKEKGRVLADMFGEHPAQTVIDEYSKRLGEVVRTGNRIVGAAGGVIPAAPAIASQQPQPKPHTFFGTRWKKA